MSRDMVFRGVLIVGIAWAGAPDGGAAEVEVAKLTASDATAWDYFGVQVSVSGERMVVGAPGDDDHGSSSGSAYVFERQPDGTWGEVQKLVPSDGAPGDLFGLAAAASGDRVVIGAPSDDDKGDLTGSAYVYERQPNGTWTNVAKLLPNDVHAKDSFGTSVSVSGDRIMAGAVYDDDKGNNAGAVYVIERQAGGAWTVVQKLVAADGGTENRFGGAVSLSGDHAVIGAALDDDNGSYSGSAYVFERQANGLWTEVAKLFASDGVAGDRFGAAVSVSGDHVVIGASTDDMGFDSGSAYVFERQSNGLWAYVQKLMPDDGATADDFGISVSVSGDRVVIGASGDDDNGGSSGSAYLYTRLANGTWTQSDKLSAADGTATAFLGGAVSMSGDHVVVGARGDDGLGQSAGAAYVFERCAPVSPYGAGCVGLNGVAPELSVEEACLREGGIMTLEIDKGWGGGDAFLFIGTDPASVSVGFDCQLLVAPVIGPIFIGKLSGTHPIDVGQGTMTLPLPVPDPFPPTMVTLQVGVVTPDAGKSWNLTNGVEIDFP